MIVEFVSLACLQQEPHMKTHTDYVQSRQLQNSSKYVPPWREGVRGRGFIGTFAITSVDSTYCAVSTYKAVTMVDEI